MELENRIKEYESKFNVEIKPYNSFILRLDGVNFSNYTKGFKSPYDDIFRMSMIQTMNDMMENFHAVTGYTQSDEITLIFAPACTREEFDNKTNKSVHIRNGRVMKICSVTASFCANRFTYNLFKFIEPIKDQYTTNFIEKINRKTAMFDCRAIEFEENIVHDVVNHQVWRRTDCERNAISQYGMHHFGHKKIFKKSTKEILEMLGDQVVIPEFIRYGVYCKKMLYNKEKAIRSKFMNISFKAKYSDSMQNLLFAKYWLNEEQMKYVEDILDYLKNEYELHGKNVIFENNMIV